jgi:hypothetical protein
MRVGKLFQNISWKTDNLAANGGQDAHARIWKQSLGERIAEVMIPAGEWVRSVRFRGVYFGRG